MVGLGKNFILVVFPLERAAQRGDTRITPFQHRTIPGQVTGVGGDRFQSIRSGDDRAAVIHILGTGGRILAGSELRSLLAVGGRLLAR